MGKGRKALEQREAVNHTVKFLSHTTDPVTVQAVLKSAPDPVIRAIANAALNARKGDVQLTPAQKRLFRAYVHTFDVLCDRNISIVNKRRHLLSRARPASQASDQSNGALPIAALIVPLLASVIGSVGSSFISRLTNHNLSSAE